MGSCLIVSRNATHKSQWARVRTMSEVGGPCNVMGMVNMFQEKLAGDGNDPDELILQAFMAYDQAGKIDVKMFQHALTTWGDKMTKTEIDDIFNEFEIDEDYMCKTK